MVHRPIDIYGLLVKMSGRNTEQQIPVCYTEVLHMMFLKWFAFPLEFISVFSKKLEDTSVSHKYKNIYQSSHIENKNSCQNPAIAGTMNMYAAKQRLMLPFNRCVLQREVNAAVLSLELDQLEEQWADLGLQLTTLQFQFYMQKLLLKLSASSSNWHTRDL